MTNVEIEDVLSSIRRLVSEDVRHGRARGAAAAESASGTRPGSGEAGAKLVLTPAQRVSNTSAALGDGGLEGRPMAARASGGTTDQAAAWRGDAEADRTDSERRAGRGANFAEAAQDAGAQDAPADGDAGDADGTGSGAAEFPQDAAGPDGDAAEVLPGAVIGRIDEDEPAPDAQGDGAGDAGGALVSGDLTFPGGEQADDGAPGWDDALHVTNGPDGPGRGGNDIGDGVVGDGPAGGHAGLGDAGWGQSTDDPLKADADVDFRAAGVWPGSRRTTAASNLGPVPGLSAPAAARPAAFDADAVGEPWRRPGARLLDALSAPPAEATDGHQAETIAQGWIDERDDAAALSEPPSSDAGPVPGEGLLASAAGTTRGQVDPVASLERTIAELEAAVAGISGEFEPEATVAFSAPTTTVQDEDDSGPQEKDDDMRGAQLWSDEAEDDAGLDEPVAGGLSVSDWTLPWPTTVTPIRPGAALPSASDRSDVPPEAESTGPGRSGPSDAVDTVWDWVDEAPGGGRPSDALGAGPGLTDGAPGDAETGGADLSRDEDPDDALQADFAPHAPFAADAGYAAPDNRDATAPADPWTAGDAPPDDEFRGHGGDDEFHSGAAPEASAFGAAMSGVDREDAGHPDMVSLETQDDLSEASDPDDRTAEDVWASLEDDVFLLRPSADETPDAPPGSSGGRAWNGDGLDASGTATAGVPGASTAAGETADHVSEAWRDVHPGGLAAHGPDGADGLNAGLTPTELPDGAGGAFAGDAVPPVASWAEPSPTGRDDARSWQDAGPAPSDMGRTPAGAASSTDASSSDASSAEAWSADAAPGQAEDGDDQSAPVQPDAEWAASSLTGAAVAQGLASRRLHFAADGADDPASTLSARRSAPRIIRPGGPDSHPDDEGHVDIADADLPDGGTLPPLDTVAEPPLMLRQGVPGADPSPQGAASPRSDGYGRVGPRHDAGGAGRPEHAPDGVSAAYDTDPEGNLFGPDGADELDDDALRDLVAEIIRQELQGTLGERITRSVRKLVRREINRILEARDLE
jgi:hypothetical protein